MAHARAAAHRRAVLPWHGDGPRAAAPRCARPGAGLRPPRAGRAAARRDDQDAVPGARRCARREGQRLAQRRLLELRRS